jgi:hypothetical protein
VAGYSGRTTTEKIGARPGQRVYIDRAPQGLDLTWPAGVRVFHRLPAAPVDIAWCFCGSRGRLEQRLHLLVTRIVDDGALWISWPKKSSGVSTDLDESVVRHHGLAAGVVDVKVAAVDDTWSALKFVRRLADRGA